MPLLLCTLVERVLNTHFAVNINLFYSMNYLEVPPTYDYLNPTVLDIYYASDHFRYLNLRIICIVRGVNKGGGELYCEVGSLKPSYLI